MPLSSRRLKMFNTTKKFKQTPKNNSEKFFFFCDDEKHEDI